MPEQTKEDALRKAKEDYKDTLIKIDVVFELIEKIKLDLPVGWEIKFDITLDIMSWHEAPSSQFRYVCKLVENASGRKLKRCVLGSSDSPFLKARSFIKVDNGSTGFSIFVILFSLDTSTCKLTLREKTITELIASPSCLGLEELKDD